MGLQRNYERGSTLVGGDLDWTYGIRSTRELTRKDSGLMEVEIDKGEGWERRESQEEDSSEVRESFTGDLSIIEGGSFHTMEELLVRATTLPPNPKRHNSLVPIRSKIPKSLPKCRTQPGNHLPVHNPQRRTCVLCTWTRQQDSHIREELTRFTQELLSKELGAGGKFWIEGRGNYKKIQLPGGLGKRPARSWVFCELCIVFLCQPLCFQIWHSWKCS